MQVLMRAINPQQVVAMALCQTHTSMGTQADLNSNHNHNPVHDTHPNTPTRIQTLTTPPSLSLSLSLIQVINYK